jgi:hypothetical protein
LGGEIGLVAGFVVKNTAGNSHKSNNSAKKTLKSGKHATN